MKKKNVFAAMNEQLHRDPTPPREINPEISRPLQEIICRATERDRRNRYASAREMAVELERHDHSGIAEVLDQEVPRPCQQRSSGNRREPLLKRVLTYASLAMIPVFLFGLMLLVAHNN